MFQSGRESRESNDLADDVARPSTELNETTEIIEIEDNNTSVDEDAIEQYQCGICSEIFATKIDFIEQHINKFAKRLICCHCSRLFTNPDELYDHHDIHKEMENMEAPAASSSIDEGLLLVKEGQEFVQVKHPDGTDMVYILDEADQDVNEVLVQENQMIQLKTGKRQLKRGQLVNLDHGYILSDGAVKNASTSKRNHSTARPRAAPLRKRHEVPDFSATNFIVVGPNDQFDGTHYKCKRCEQLFINKFGFYRHIEKGKCYVNGCDACSATFNTNSEFYAHYVEEHADRAVCHFCFRTFMYEKNVKEHMLRHLDQFRHRCEECNKGFYTVREYRNHYKNRHMGIRYKCEICARTFADEYYFKKHRDTHHQVSAPNITFVEFE